MKQSPQQTGPVLLVSSQGGHLAHLLALRTWWEGQDRLWVCPDTPDVVDRLDRRAGGPFVLADDPEPAQPAAQLGARAPAAAPRAAFAARELPAPGSRCPSSSAAWLLRIPTVFIEVYDRVDTPTMTGRLCGPFTTRRLVQWQSQLDFYPDARLVGPLL